ncbi:MAG: hypothetical protein ACLUJR_03230 [Mediterraneibacter gnavus]
MKQAADKKMNPLQQLVKMLADVFVPIIPALVASGLLMGLNNVLTAQGTICSRKIAGGYVSANCRCSSYD